MNRLGRREKDKVSQFKHITGSSDKIAIDCLKASGWSVEAGIEYYYSSGLQHQSAASGVDSKAIEALFHKYKDPHSEAVFADGIQSLCDDLEVDPSDIALLVLSWHLRAATMCEYTHDEFATGLARLGCDSLDKLRAKLPELRAELRDPSRFAEVYTFAFKWASEKGQMCLQLDTALAMWGLLFAGERAWQLLPEWCDFLQQVHHGRAISKDTWVQLLEFQRNIKPDFSNFDPSGAWPYLIDEFVERQREKAG